MTGQTPAAARRPIRVGNCSGFYGDRFGAFADMVRAGVDVITGDYLAEVTMLVLAKTRVRDPEAGYATSFLRQLEPHLADIARQGTKVVVNAGGLAPATLAKAVRAACERAGVTLKVAHVEGDDIRERIDDLAAAGELTHLLTGQSIADWKVKPLTANAYLGAWGIVEALAHGADIVVCPRVTDASLVVGAAAWWHGWTREDHDAIAGAIAAGHVIECGTQATGGNFSGFQAIGLSETPDFPIAEIAADGSSVITVAEGAKGVVSVDTVTAQLLYEIQDNDYRNPDATLLLDSIALSQEAPNRVRIAGVRGTPPPPRTKVAVTGIGGFRNVGMMVMTGLAVEEKAALVERQLRARFEGQPVRLRFDLLGRPDPDARDQAAASAVLRVTIKGPEQLVGRTFFDTLTEFALGSYPGQYRLESGARQANSFGDYFPALVRQDELRHRAVLADGEAIEVPPPATVAEPDPREPAAPVAPGDWGETEQAALGRLFLARSGDKGGDGNVGVWAHDARGYAWLAEHLTVEWMRGAMPETADLAIERHLLPNLNAVNFVVHGLLGTGATATLRLDAQAKALGEYLLARPAALPRSLLVANSSP